MEESEAMIHRDTPYPAVFVTIAEPPDTYSPCRHPIAALHPPRSHLSEENSTVQ